MKDEAKSETNPKAQNKKQKNPLNSVVFNLAASDFEFVSDFGFRIFN
jgi:hypothetical protein